MYLHKEDMACDSIIRKFDKKQFNEAAKLLKKRWNINNLSKNIIKNKVVLDVGCGEGRYSYALHKMGAKKVIGLDYGKKPKNFPKKIKYISGSVLNLKFRKNSFDLVFCNGRLSHTKNWEVGLKEIFKVCKKEGWIWLSLFGKGKHWSYSDRLRKKLNLTDAKNFEKALLLRDWEPDKIFFLIDAFFSQERIYFTKKKINKSLKQLGVKKINFLTRGIKKDLNEKIFKNKKLKKIYGEGEIRLVAQKP